MNIEEIIYCSCSFNNPVLAGLIEAFKEGIKLQDVQVVSLGTGNKLMTMTAKDEFWKLEQIAIRKRRKKLAFWHWGSQAKFFKETVLNQAKTILYQPPDWANYVAMIFLNATTNKETEDNFIRLSPLIHLDKNTPNHIEPLLQKLDALDMDLTKDSDIDLLFECFNHWKTGEIINQPVEFKVLRNNEIVYKKGDREYKSALERWRNWDS